MLQKRLGTSSNQSNDTETYKSIAQGKVILPMQPNISETNSIDWGGDKMNPVQMAAASLAMEAINNLGELEVGQAVSDLFTAQ